VDKRREALVGIVVILGIAAGVAGSIWLKGGWGSGGQVVRAVSPDAGQTTAGATVKFRGVDVGRVDRVSIAPGGDAVLIEMIVRPDLALPPQAAMLLAPESMFGDWQVEIVSRNDFPSRVFLERPDLDALPGTALPDVSRLTSTADEIAGNLAVISDRFRIAFSEETAENLRRAIDNISAVSDGLAEVIDQQASRFDDLADGVDRSAQDLGAAARAARLSFERIDAILQNADVETMATDAGAAAANVRIVAQDAGLFLNDLRAAVQRADSTFARLDRLTAGAEAGEGSLGRLLSDPTLANEAEEALAEIAALLADVRENPGRYFRFSVF